MRICRDKSAKGVTIIELMITILAVSIFIVCIVSILAEGHVGYHKLFRRVHSDVVRNAYEARRVFDRIARKSSIRRCDLFTGNNEVYVYYFADPQNLLIEDPDRYARFYLNGTELWLEEGTVAVGTFEAPPPSLPSLTATSNMRLASDVVAPEEGIFSMRGASVRMAFLLDSETNPEPGQTRLETLQMTVTTTAIRHNW
jgi:hypothetical protein